MNKFHKPLVSVIIPVFNGSKSLEKCLEALEAQSYPRESYEVIVVDNASDENIKLTVFQFSKVRYEYEHIRGSYAARNKGIKSAQGQLIAFTDSDCIPAFNWLEELVYRLQSQENNCGLIAGSVKSTIKSKDKATPSELYDSLFAFPQKRYVEEYKFGVTANLMTPVEVLEKVGLFNSNLKSGGDYEWGYRVFSAGYHLTYAESAVVFHPARENLDELITKSVRVVEGHYELVKLKVYSPIRFLLASLIDFFFPFRSALFILFNRQIDDFSDRTAVAWVSTRVKYARALRRLQLQLLGTSRN